MGDLLARGMAKAKVDITKLIFLVNTVINDTNSWRPTSNYSTISFINNVMTVVGTGVHRQPAVRQKTNLRLIPGHKILVKAKYIKVTNAVCSELNVFVTNDLGINLSTYYQIISNPVQDAEYPIVFIATVPNSMYGTLNINVRSAYIDAETANGKTMQLEDFMVIDITSSYGVNSEPLASEISEAIDTYFGGYFDGEKSLYIAQNGGESAISSGQDANLGSLTATSVTTDALYLLGMLPTGTLSNPPAGLEIGDVWADTTDSAQYPVLRTKVSL